jgi:hypothetical protein
MYGSRKIIAYAYRSDKHKRRFLRSNGLSPKCCCDLQVGGLLPPTTPLFGGHHHPTATGSWIDLGNRPLKIDLGRR